MNPTKTFHADSLHSVLDLRNDRLEFWQGLLGNTGHVEAITIKRAGDGISVEVKESNHE